MALTKITKSGITNDSVDATKIADNAVETAQIKGLNVTTAKLAADAVDATKLADDAVSEEHLDVTAITGNTQLSANAAADDVLLIFDTSSSSIKKINAGNVGLQVPTITSISPTNLLTGDGSGNHTIVITGTGYISDATAKMTTQGGTDIAFDSVTRNSSTQLTCVVAKNKANLTTANEPFDISVTTAGALTATSADAFNIDASPVFVTGSGSLGTGTGGTSVNFKVVATDPESNATQVTFELQSGTLPAGLALTTSNADGGTAIISGTATDPAGNTTSNFVLRAVDAASNTTSRAFAITINKAIQYQTFTSSGTFTVPSGVTTLNEVLVVGGGGGGAGGHNGTIAGGAGGAGGLVLMPNHPVQAGTITVTVGSGGGHGVPEVSGTVGQDSAFGAPGDPGLDFSGSFNITAKGGGYGGGRGADGGPGGSGGGGGGGNNHSCAGGPNNTGAGGPAIQPTQPGNSGSYGFGTAGGAGGVNTRAGGGGGAATAGAGSTTGAGGTGKAYTIADGTTPVYYAGGGGGGASIGNHNPGGSGGQGGGGAGQNTGPVGDTPSAQGTGGANKGGGGGGGSSPGRTGFDGGKGVVIVKY